MGFATSVGKYHLGRTIGEGNFAKVKLGFNMDTNDRVAIKIIDKKMVLDNKLMDQVKREISTMKLLHHPNIVKIYEVIATKSKIYLVMEYASGGQLSDKMLYLKRLEEKEARKYFQQLIDAVDYCHGKGVYHRDLKPENLLLDHEGNIKVSDFGLSVLKKPGEMLSTSCGSPSYVAPEVIAHNNYEGAAADMWSCGVILFELLAGHLPFEDRSLTNLYRKITRAEYTCPAWFTDEQRRLISRILDPLAIRRATVAELLEDEWFRVDYTPSPVTENEEDVNLDIFPVASDKTDEITDETVREKSNNFINAFQLIAMSNDLDLSGLFENQENSNQKTKFGSTHSVDETIEKIEVAAKGACLSVERINNSKIKLHQRKNLARCKSLFTVSAEVTEVTPTNCVVEISKSARELLVYNEFCRSLSNLLKENTDGSSDLQLSEACAEQN
ncbi:Non-specific serine/threonine protein kinase protein [Dioscorea alata]|uniref:Non-specific serine/threonine protein kinase protein n=6 Tax=Dioscorea alata TaxID=55571 RepID=A0ACB7VDC8_DIOAL|nr:Non-specific serine/threonine protein kinase protein [Dioscorea alata]KAH7671767.1 Non-specific serine/threonine protein kinase protein [Dioscorea alata]KAH7671769.1 Non-specific serine/threonine protein kinase protein [Dioscorea alata]KAH7671770.1 Non-specific serine/threonine protein kinase protein [Dioscorea alata]